MLFYTSNAKMSQKARLLMPLYTNNGCFLYLVAPQCFLTCCSTQTMQRGARKPDWVVGYEAQQAHGDAEPGSFMWSVEQACILQPG